MQTVILAAGMGTRLGELTVARPKALIDVAGRPLIDYALAFADAAVGGARLVVAGFCNTAVAGRVAVVAPDARVVENADYRKGNLLSLCAALPLIDRTDGFLLMNADHIYRPTIAELVAAAGRRNMDVTAFCDFDRQLGADDMKVRLRETCVQDMSKTLPSWDCGYVGMTWVPPTCIPRYLDAVDAVRASAGDSANVEAVLVELASTDAPPVFADISGHGWLEIDEPHERERAERVLATERWWGP